MIQQFSVLLLIHFWLMKLPLNNINLKSIDELTKHFHNSKICFNKYYVMGSLVSIWFLMDAILRTLNIFAGFHTWHRA